MVELDRLVENNGKIREYFIGFLESGTFNRIISAMEEQKLKIAEINYGNHRVIIDATNDINNIDAEDSRPSRKGSIFGSP